MNILLPIRRSLGLSQHALTLRIYQESGHVITQGWVSMIERGKANPPAWLRCWMHRYAPRRRPDYKGISVKAATHARLDALRCKWGLTWDELMCWLMQGRG